MTASTEISSATAPARARSAGTVVTDLPGMDAWRSFLHAHARITRRLDENPSGYLFGREKTKEFTP